MKILIILVVCGICDSVPKILPRHNRKIIPRHLPLSIRSQLTKTHHTQKQKAAYLTKDHKLSPEHDEVSYSKPVYTRETQKEIPDSCKPVYAPEYFEVPYIDLIYAPEYNDMQYTREMYGPELIPGMII